MRRLAKDQIYRKRKRAANYGPCCENCIHWERRTYRRTEGYCCNVERRTFANDGAECRLYHGKHEVRV